MQFTSGSHAAVESGAITVTFRRWARPHAKVGGRYNVGRVVIEVDEVELMPFGAIDDADLRKTGLADREALRSLAAHSGPIDDDTIVYRVEFHVVGPRNAEPRPADSETVAAVVAKLDGMDRRRPTGPWTATTLGLIARHPGVVSTELAVAAQRERADFKVDVRKLKALGLTESLEVGYRLTALGEAVVRVRTEPKRRTA